MTVVFIEQSSNHLVHAIDLGVEQSGMSITLKAGSFKYNGVDYELVEDQVFEATERDDVTYIDARLCRDTTDNSIILIVDEMIDIGGEPGDRYEWHNSPYEVLWPMYVFKVPASTASLDAIEISAYRVVEPPEPEVE